MLKFKLYFHIFAVLAIIAAAASVANALEDLASKASPVQEKPAAEKPNANEASSAQNKPADAGVDLFALYAKLQPEEKKKINIILEKKGIKNEAEIKEHFKQLQGKPSIASVFNQLNRKKLLPQGRSSNAWHANAIKRIQALEDSSYKSRGFKLVKASPAERKFLQELIKLLEK